MGEECDTSEIYYLVHMPMIQIIEPELEDYAEKHSHQHNPLLQELQDYTYRHCEWPQMVTGSLQGSLLRMLVQITAAKNILEIGLFTGYSSLTMAEVLPAGGGIVSCEIDENNAAVARSFIERSPDADKIEIRLGPALETLESLRGPFDLAFLDADKENYSAYYDAVLPLLRPGGLLIADNVLWSGRVLDPDTEADHALVAFNKKVAGDPAVEVALLTVRDGVSVIRKR
jgi:caffeoyl-CoA O-methyltransferase